MLPSNGRLATGKATPLLLPTKREITEPGGGAMLLAFCALLRMLPV